MVLVSINHAPRHGACEDPEMLIRLSNMDFDDTEHSVVRARVFGELATGTYPGQPWNRVEPLMAETWQQIRGESRLSWEDVRNEAHAAWQVAKLEREGHLRDNAPVTLDRAA
jgi:hypothetical protein